MARRKKGEVKSGRGAMCNICGKNCGRGGALKVHLNGAHQINYKDYKKSFYDCSKIITDTWDISGKISKTGESVIMHVLVRKFIAELGKRGVRTTSK